MLSVKTCRAILVDDAPASDEKLEQVRDQLYAIAHAWFDVGLNTAITEPTLALDVNDRADIEERAAMMEYDGQMSRDDAERNAIALQLARKHRRPQ